MHHSIMLPKPNDLPHPILIDASQSLPKIAKQLDDVHRHHPHSERLSRWTTPSDVFDRVNHDDALYLNLPPNTEQSRQWAVDLLSHLCGEPSRAGYYSVTLDDDIGVFPFAFGGKSKPTVERTACRSGNRAATLAGVDDQDELEDDNDERATSTRSTSRFKSTRRPTPKRPKRSTKSPSRRRKDSSDAVSATARLAAAPSLSSRSLKAPAETNHVFPSLATSSSRRLPSFTEPSSSAPPDMSTPRQDLGIATPSSTRKRKAAGSPVALAEVPAPEYQLEPEPPATRYYRNMTIERFIELYHLPPSISEVLIELGFSYARHVATFTRRDFCQSKQDGQGFGLRLGEAVHLEEALEMWKKDEGES